MRFVRNLVLLSLIAGVDLFICSVDAESTPQEKSIDFSGIFDLFYIYNFNNPRVPAANSSAPASPGVLVAPPQPNNALRYFDLYHNQFGLNLAELSVIAKKADLTFTMDLDFGLTSDFTHGAPGNTDEVSKHLGQAVLTYHPTNLPRLKFFIGKMPTPMGWESTKSKDNWQYSRSVTFAYGMPFWHLGVGASYDFLPDQLTTSVYLFNGWNNLIDNNSGKTMAGQIKWQPTSVLTATYNLLFGPEQNRNNSDYRQVHEFNIVISPLTVLSFALETLAGWEQGTSDGTATWQGVTLASKWQICSRYAFSPRLEFYRDPDGFTLAGGYSKTGPSEKYYGVTVTNLVSVGNGFEARVEARYDRSNQGTRFYTADGTSKNQTSLGAALIFSF